MPYLKRKHTIPYTTEEVSNLGFVTSRSKIRSTHFSAMSRGEIVTNPSKEEFNLFNDF
jgi:hypothetical protein